MKFICKRAYSPDSEALFTVPGPLDPSSETFRKIAKEKGLRPGEIVEIVPILGARDWDSVVQFAYRTLLVP